MAESNNTKSLLNMSGDEYSSALTDDHKKFGRQTLPVGKMVEDIRRILISKFNCRTVDVDDLVSEVCYSMLNNKDFNAWRGGRTTYIYYKCQSAWLNALQRKKNSREVFCEEGTPEDRSTEEVRSEGEFDPEEFAAFLLEVHGKSSHVYLLYEQLRLGYHFHQARSRLGLSSKEFADARKLLKSSGHAFFSG